MRWVLILKRTREALLFQVDKPLDWKDKPTQILPLINNVLLGTQITMMRTQQMLSRQFALSADSFEKVPFMGKTMKNTRVFEIQTQSSTTAFFCPGV